MPKISTYFNSPPLFTDKVIGTVTTNNNETKNFSLENIMQKFNHSAVPATATSTGIRGQFASDATHLYICTATDTWKRVAIATF